ncbi:major facilitator superfamily protein [Stylonychia lemnae]|uniref:Major facilitator superfamily protein n=1 Tax=Stylonychia lemnae TaxID=5949 RepID=A0A078AAA7_STYLE|nr:major facilitator superfamily protein [Stylonychia lemnae]|eukprot:CDW79190.1 major facilitator superfamily protein [Stylonychia lemnae]
MPKYTNLGNVTYLSVGILLLYMAQNSSANIQSVIMEENGFEQLGFFILAVLYFFMGMGSLLSTAIINKYGTRFCLVIGGVGNVQWIVSTLLAVYRESILAEGVPIGIIYCGLLLSTVINGFTVGVLWAAANQYIADCSSDSNKGFFFSYFWSFYMTSQIFGNLIAAFVLGHLEQDNYFEIMAGVASLATLTFFFLKRPQPVGLQFSINALRLVEDSNDYTHPSFVSSSIYSTSQPTFWSDIKSVLILLVSKKMRPLVPQLCWTGVSIAVYTGILLPIITDTLDDKDTSHKFELSMLAMVSLGVGEIVGAIGMGMIVDKIGSKKSCWVNIFLVILQTLAVLLFLYIDEYNWIAFMMTFLWGVQDSSISIHLDAILGFEFETNKEPFACDILMESITAFSFEILQSFMKTKYQRVIYISAVGGIGVFCTLSSFFFEYKPDAIHVRDSGRIHRKSFILNRAPEEVESIDSITDPNVYLISS